MPSRFRGVLRRGGLNRDRDIETSPLLWHLGGREVRCHATLREREAGVADRGLHPFAGLLDGPIGQADDREARQAGILCWAASSSPYEATD